MPRFHADTSRLPRTARVSLGFTAHHHRLVPAFGSRWTPLYPLRCHDCCRAATSHTLHYVPLFFTFHGSPSTRFTTFHLSHVHFLCSPFTTTHYTTQVRCRRPPGCRPSLFGTPVFRWTFVLSRRTARQTTAERDAAPVTDCCCILLFSSSRTLGPCSRCLEHVTSVRSSLRAPLPLAPRSSERSRLHRTPIHFVPRSCPTLKFLCRLRCTNARLLPLLLIPHQSFRSSHRSVRYLHTRGHRATTLPPAITWAVELDSPPRAILASCALCCLVDHLPLRSLFHFLWTLLRHVSAIHLNLTTVLTGPQLPAPFAHTPLRALDLANLCFHRGLHPDSRLLAIPHGCRWTRFATKEPLPRFGPVTRVLRCVQTPRIPGAWTLPHDTGPFHQTHATRRTPP